MKNLVAFPVLLVVIVLQSAIVSRLTLLSGFADLVLLLLVALSLHKRANTAWLWGLISGLTYGFVSGVPLPAVIIGYLGVAGFARLVQRRVWESPILAMFLVTFLGTIFVHAVTFIGLWLVGAPLPFEESFSLITLPSLFLNMILAIPVYTVVRDLADWLYTVERTI